MIPVLVAFGSFLTTLAGGFAALRFHDQQHLILGLAAGLMLGVVGFDLVPEALTQQPSVPTLGTATTGTTPTEVRSPWLRPPAGVRSRHRSNRQPRSGDDDGC
jgi:cyanate permease